MEFEKTVAVIGAGWYGSHISLALVERGYRVTLFENKEAIFEGLSGKFGIRLHAGPHYPRSEATRQSCHDGYLEFIKSYPDLVLEHDYAIYALGKIDANGKPAKVDKFHFKKVCEEFSFIEEIDVGAWGFNPLVLEAAFKVQEPSIAIGKKLQKFFQQRLMSAGVEVFCHASVVAIEMVNKGFMVNGCQVSQKVQQKFQLPFRYVVNTTSYCSQVPPQLPIFLKYVYQPCLGIYFEDKQPEEKPFSFTVMDGAFPCIMPCDESSSKPVTKYCSVHGKWTIMGSYEHVTDARQALSSIDDIFVNEKVRKPIELEMSKIWPSFLHRFWYKGWTGEVIAKLKTGAEFRSSVVFQDQRQIIYIFPGKINNIFEAEREVVELMEKKSATVNSYGTTYLKSSNLGKLEKELKEHQETNYSTSRLQTYREELDKKR